jgi:hypothetical protein
MTRKPKPIGSILEQTLKALEIDLPLKTYSICNAWKEIVGESVALQTQPRSIRNRILFLDVSHPAWMQQLQFLKATLLERINRFLGEPQIEDIRFKLGKISAPAPKPTLRSRSWQAEKVDGETLSRIHSILQKIDDEEVRKSLGDILINSARVERSRRKKR